jgi:hypothetical protein
MADTNGIIVVLFIVLTPIIVFVISVYFCYKLATWIDMMPPDNNSPGSNGKIKFEIKK